MVELLPIVAWLLSVTAQDGWLSQYDQGPTDATIAYRQKLGDIPADLSPYDGVIAVEDCGQIGKDAYLFVSGRWHRVMVFDCPGHAWTRDWMRDNNLIAEMGYYLTESLGLVGQGGIPGLLVIFGEAFDGTAASVATRYGLQ
jgi:hypothetical protein